MPTIEERNQKLDEVKKNLASLAEVDPITLARTSELAPDINFSDAVPHFRKMLELCRQLSKRDLTRLPGQKLDAIAATCEKLNELINEVKDFTLHQINPGGVCEEIIKKVSAAYDDLMDPLLLPLAFTATQATDYAKIEREATDLHVAMKTQAEEFSEFISKTREEVKRALEAIKGQAAEAGVSTNAHIFTSEAEKYENSARKWLAATVAMGLVTLVATSVALVITFFYRPVDFSATIQYVLAKLLVISTLYFALIWCARQYRAQKHNETLNKHRANALRTFQAFVAGASDERVKDAVLLLAAQAAFAGRSTGFNDQESEPSIVNPVVEVFGKMLPHSGGSGKSGEISG